MGVVDISKMRERTMRERHSAIIVDKHKDPLMRVLSKLFPPFRLFWTTYRLPFMKYARICHPPGIENPHRYAGTIAHELVHVEQLRPAWGPLVMFLGLFLPLPVLFSGRWFIERRAYLVSISNGDTDPQRAADTLWRSYGWPWPRSWMVKWFEAHR